MHKRPGTCYLQELRLKLAPLLLNCPDNSELLKANVPIHQITKGKALELNAATYESMNMKSNTEDDAHPPVPVTVRLTHYQQTPGWFPANFLYTLCPPASRHCTAASPALLALSAQAIGAQPALKEQTVRIPLTAKQHTGPLPSISCYCSSLWQLLPWLLVLGQEHQLRPKADTRA